MGEVQKKLGYALKLEREQRNLSLEDLSQQLKISESNLQAIEDGDTAALPGELYFKMFARSYAEALGIDYERTIEAIKEELGQAPDSNNHVADDVAPEAASVAPPPKLTSGETTANSGAKRSFATSVKSFALLAVMALVVIGLAFVLFGPRSGKFGFFRIGDAQTDMNAVDSGDDGSEADAGAYRVVAGSKDASTLILELQARDRTWATVIADGDTALNYNLKPYREYVVGAQEKLTVSVMSPLSVDMSLNGIEVDLSDPEKGTVQSVEVTTDNMSLFIKRALTDSAGLDTTGDFLSEPISDSFPTLSASPKSDGAIKPKAAGDTVRRTGSGGTR